MNLLRYNVESGWITAEKMKEPKCANRPIYCANTNVQVLAGDLPIIRLGHGRHLLGSLRLYAALPEGNLYLDEVSGTSFAYRPSQVRWEIQDKRLDTAILLELGVAEETAGYVLRITVNKPITLGWEYGGMKTFPNPPGGANWNLSLATESEITEQSLLAEECSTPMEKEKLSIGWKLWEKQERPVYMVPPAGLEHEEEKWLGGTFEVESQPVFFLVAQQYLVDPQKIYESAKDRSRRLMERIISCTPEPYLDMAMSVVSAEIDGSWYPPKTMHSTQVYNMPFLGWCNRFGHTYSGWFERAEEELACYAPLQNGFNGKTGFERDTERMECLMGPGSRYYGEGHIDTDQGMYNMQSQFFDQMIHAWRMTASEKLEELLYPALQKHTRWQDECFDPDEDGLYESYINTWPTDSVWYNGGGSCEETCYAYTSHQAAEEMALHKGDAEEALYHKNVLARIRKGFFEKLWIEDKGYPGMMIEKGSHGRLHESAWQYNSFLPVIADMLSPFQEAMAVWYSKWGLENVQFPFGGRTIWMSNWVPSVWSVRKIGGGENFQQAHAFFKAGFPEEGWDLLYGHMVKSDFDEVIPGGIVSEAASLLTRAVISGLHGYQPDYPNGRVILSPQYPAAWKQAEIHTSYLDVQFSRKDSRIQYVFHLEKTAQVTVRLPLYAKKLITVSGADDWRVVPGFGTSILEIFMEGTVEGRIVAETEGAFYPGASQNIQAVPLDTIALNGNGIVAIHDPQHILEKEQITAEGAELSLKEISGHHICFLEYKEEDAHYYQLVELELSSTVAENRQKEREKLVPALKGEKYIPIDIQEHLFADVRTIFRQSYVSPKPQGVCLTIGTDGFSPWTFPYWGKGAPEIGLNEQQLSKRTLETPSGIPFLWNGGRKNVAFTALWDNWPTKITVPIGEKAKRIYLLLIGSSNPMQCHIANAVLQLTYIDGTREELEVENPRNFWSLCGYEGEGQIADQAGTNDYDYAADSYCLPEIPPEVVQLGKNCRGVVLSWELLADKILESVTLETLSQEVVIGLSGITLLKEIK